ncbi:deoxycytidylate deaminase [Niveomyces insectorum RCEF 264]|uniref:Deoxycytidylate deaminase n=1 Tax=Niveomyces insectorum RCEF 264 TaxID=1081102 RepID=A0A168AB79_9HYPO|nr:deoxycytidylate deaminase [Niveomyces insectorum RCEF 264]
MLIGICGSICAGKSTVAQYLVERQGFTRLFIRENKYGHSADNNGDGNDNDTSSVSSASSSLSPIAFPTAEALLDYVTTRWRERWVTTDVTNEAVLDVFNRRPFFLLISVDAPVAVRWRRAQQRAARKTAAAAPDDLETFVARSDAELYGAGTTASTSSSEHPPAPLLPVMARAALRLVNGGYELRSRGGHAAVPSFSSTALFAALDHAGLTVAGFEQLLRPSWDRYFMALASLAAQRSNCMKRRVGCVLVREHRVVSTGYNGTPRGLRNCGEGGCGRCNGGVGAGVGLATCLCLHAEENALLEAGRERIPTASLAHTTLYCDTCPCLTCSIKIAQVGIGEVVYSQGYSMDVETAAVLQEAGVQLRQFVPPTQGLIHLDKIVLP